MSLLAGRGQQRMRSWGLAKKRASRGGGGAMRGRKGRGGVAGIIGGLLRVGSPGRGRSVANVTERRCCVKINMCSTFFVFQPLICSTAMDILRPRKRPLIGERLSHRDPDLAH